MLSLEEIESKKTSLLEEFAKFEPFSKVMLDAFALIDFEGKVVKNNPLFTTLVGKTSRQIQKIKNLEQMLTFRLDGKEITIADLTKLTQPTRFDEVRGETEAQKDLNMILGVYPFDHDGERLGYFLLIRDVTAETNLQDKYKVKATQSITDKLTGLYNRLYFDQYLPQALKKLEEMRGKDDDISVVMADIDHFKQVNDRFGHLAGDYILEEVSSILKSNFRKTDIICRYGGEEFLAILPQTDLVEAHQAAEKLRKAIEKHEFHFNKTKIPMTLSLGVAQIKVGHETAEEAIARADAALYYAKENGRNRVITSKDKSES